MSSYNESGIPYTESAEIDHPGPNSPTANTSSGSGRRGHLFFGSICDMRTATFAVHGFNILLKAIFILIRHITLGYFGHPAGGYMSMMLSAIAIFGAYTYEYLATGLASLGFGLFLLGNFIAFDFIGAIADILLLYPVLTLSYEMKNGIITKENFHAQEEYIEPQLNEHIQTHRQAIETQMGRFTGN